MQFNIWLSCSARSFVVEIYFCFSTQQAIRHNLILFENFLLLYDCAFAFYEQVIGVHCNYIITNLNCSYLVATNSSMKIELIGKINALFSINN